MAAGHYQVPRFEGTGLNYECPGLTDQCPGLTRDYAETTLLHIGALMIHIGALTIHIGALPEEVRASWKRHIGGLTDGGRMDRRRIFSSCSNDQATFPHRGPFGLIESSFDWRYQSRDQNVHVLESQNELFLQLWGGKLLLPTDLRDIIGLNLSGHTISVFPSPPGAGGTPHFAGRRRPPAESGLGKKFVSKV